MDKDFRTYFASKPGLIHLNNAGLSPTNIKAEAIVHHWVERYRREGAFCNEAYREAVEESRHDLAQLLDADNGSVAFFSCTSAAASQLALQLDLAPGQEVLMWDQEYGSHLYPWQEACRRTGATLVLAESADDLGTPVERLLSRVSDKTRVIAVSWVQFQTGAITDLSPLVELKKTRDIWIVVDGIQGIGIRPFSFRNSGIDALVGGSHKWLTAPVGVGYLCVTAERARTLKPLSIGAGSYEEDGALKADALKFESGTKQALEIVGLGTSARLLQNIGTERLLEKSMNLGRLLFEGLESLGYKVAQPNGPGLLTPILNVTTSLSCALGDLETMGRALQKNRISYARRGPGLRLSPHAHNSKDDINEVLRVFSGKIRAGL